MAASTSPADRSTGRAAPRTRPSASTLPERQQRIGTPGSPRTPQLGRSISSQFGSPGSFRTELEEYVVYELGSRSLRAGFAGEGRPRCVMKFSPANAKRTGDYREWDVRYARPRKRVTEIKQWGEGYELYQSDIRGLDLRLVKSQLERAVRLIHTDFLQLDPKPRKAVLAIPSLLATPILEIALNVLFSRSPPPPSVTVLTTPILATVSAGLRCALVVEIGWEEAVVTAVGEYKEVLQRRSIRAGKMLTREMGAVLEAETSQAGVAERPLVGFEEAQEVTERMGWCRPRAGYEPVPGTKVIPLPVNDQARGIDVSFQCLSEPAERTLFASGVEAYDVDDHDIPLHQLVYQVLVALPLDLRAICVSRIVITGGVSRLPGLKHRLLDELQTMIRNRGWDTVQSYGSVTAHHDHVRRERDANVAAMRQKPPDPEIPFSPTKKPIQDSIPHSQRLHDDVRDPITLKAERHTLARQPATLRAVVRGVETLGAWSGASLVANMRIKGVHEVEREDFLKHGLRDDGGSVF